MRISIYILTSKATDVVVDQVEVADHLIYSSIWENNWNANTLHVGNEF